MSHRSMATIETARRVVDTAADRQVTFLAAAIAYYAFVSLIPALLLLVVVSSVVFGETIAARLVAIAGDFITPAGEEAVEAAVLSAGGRAGASVLGVAVLVWSTLKVFRGLDVAFVSLYGVENTPDLLRELMDAASVVLAIGVGIGVMVGVGAFLTAAGAIHAVETASILALPVFLTVVFLPVYYLLPQPRIAVREALPGAVFAGVGWTVLQTGFQVYAASAGQYQVYGVIGGVLLLVTWLYVAAIIVVVGGVVNVVVAERTPPASTSGPLDDGGVSAGGDRQLQHGRDRPSDMNGESDGADDAGDDERPQGAPDVAALQAEVRRLRAEFDEFEEDVERRTVDKPAVESELKRYVRSRMRRGHARGWGPYLVLLYGTVLIFGAFAYLDGLTAIAAMVILGLSTLGLYTLFIIVGMGLNLIEAPGKAFDYARSRRDD